MIATARALFALALGLACGCSAPVEAPEDTTLGLSVPDEALPLLGGRAPESSVSPTATVGDYTIGDEFGKRPVTDAELASATDAYKRASRAAAKVGGATGFYLGKFGGVHVMATNHHVYSTMSCSGRSVSFPLLNNLTLPCTRMFGTWNNINLALFEVTVQPQDEAKLAAVGANFTFHEEIKKGAALITVGFGVAANPSRKMMGNRDADCRVMSKDGEYRFMADPDEVNPGPYKAWSFSHACDISHGDSGSAMVDRATGKPVGIVWTGTIPHADRVKSSTYLQQVLDTDHADVWAELNYAVPATKMREHIETVIANTSTPADTRRVLQALIAPPPATN